MNPTCHWCSRNMTALPSGILICITCDIAPGATIPILRKAKP